MFICIPLDQTKSRFGRSNWEFYCYHRHWSMIHICRSDQMLLEPPYSCLEAY